MADPFEKLLQQIRDSSAAMAETLTAVKANTELTNTTLISQQAAAKNVVTETQRNIADTIPDKSDPSTLAGGGLKEVTKILKDLRECAC